MEQLKKLETAISSEDIRSLWESSRLLVTDECKTPPIVLRVDDSIIGTLGNFSALTGKAKSRKTFNVSAIVASALLNGTVLNYRASLPNNKWKVLYVDTEQSPFHCKRVIDRILRLAELPLETHPDRLEFLSLHKYSPCIRLMIIQEAIYNTDNLGLVIIDGVRDLAYDINSPAEATELITKLMQWTDERQIHIHTVLHMNKGDNNIRGHLGTELNNKAETILQITKDLYDKDISSVSSMTIRDVDFDPFAFRIDDSSLPVLLENYECAGNTPSKSFDYNEVTEDKHREALEALFSETECISYSSLIDKLRVSYLSIGYDFGINKAKQLKVFLENKRMIIKEEKSYRYNPDFHY